MKRESLYFILGLAAVAVFVMAIRWWLFAATGFVADDAYITYRYAENWVNGNGLVYNVGEKVLGTTTPLLTLLIAAGLALGIPAVFFSPALNIACDAATAILIVMLFRRHFGRTGFGFLAAALYAVFPSPWVWSTSGMEVSLYALCLTASLYSFVSRRTALSFFFLGCALLTRIDALVLLVALVMASAAARERTGFKPWLVLAATVAPWLIASALYYGSPVPNSLLAKKVFYGELEQFRSAPVEIILGFLFGGKSSLVASHYSAAQTVAFSALAFLALLGLVPLSKKGGRFWALPLWLCGYVAFFIVGKTHMHPWYFAPFYAIYLPLAALGLMAAWDFVLRRLQSPALAGALQAGAAATAVAVIAAGTVYEMQLLGHWLKEYQKTENFLADMSRWVGEQSRPQDKIYYSDIGKLGYFSRRSILDSVGIVSPVVTKHYRNRDWLGPIREVKPEWVLFCETDFRLKDFLSDPELKGRYAEVKRFDYKKSEHYSNAVYSKGATVEFPEILVFKSES